MTRSLESAGCGGSKLARRSDNPLSILVLGVLSIGFFGGVVVYFNETRPILKLRPVLVAKFGSPAFKTRFVPRRGMTESSIAVVVPAELSDRQKRLEIGLFSLPEYRRLADGKTRVTGCSVVAANTPTEEPVFVTWALLDSLRATEEQGKGLRAGLKRLGLRHAALSVVAYSFTGASVEVRGRVRKAGRAGPLASKSARYLSRVASIGRCKVTVTGPDKTVTVVKGRDVVAKPKATVAPIDTRTP